MLLFLLLLLCLCSFDSQYMNSVWCQTRHWKSRPSEVWIWQCNVSISPQIELCQCQMWKTKSFNIFKINHSPLSSGLLLFPNFATGMRDSPSVHESRSWSQTIVAAPCWSCQSRRSKCPSQNATKTSNQRHFLQIWVLLLVSFASKKWKI